MCLIILSATIIYFLLGCLFFAICKMTKEYSDLEAEDLGDYIIWFIFFIVIVGNVFCKALNAITKFLSENFNKRR